MSVLSDEAKFLCVAGGMLLGIAGAAVATAIHPIPHFLELPESYPRFDSDTLDRWRREDRNRALLALSENGTACDEDGHKTLREAIFRYFSQRARNEVLARHYLSNSAVEDNRRLWETPDDKKVEAGVIEAARAGTLSRADFRPILPELAALIDRGSPVVPICR